MFESWYASRRARNRRCCWIGCEAHWAEARAAAERLVAVGELSVPRCRDTGEREDWAADTWEAVAARVAATVQTSMAMGSSYLRYAVAMRDRLPEVGMAFQIGLTTPFRTPTAGERTHRT